MQNSPEISTSIHLKVKNELTGFIYPNLLTTLPLLIFIAFMLAFKLNGHVSKIHLLLWLGALVAVTACQGALAIWFKKTKDSLKWDHLYYKLLIADVGLIGILWGIAGVIFMPDDTIAQSYLIFALIFVAAGGPLYLLGSSLAGSVYASGVLIPLIGSLIYSFFSQTHHEIYFNITLGLVSYWILLVALSYYGSKLIADNIKYSLVNRVLSEDLSNANEELEKVTSALRTEEEKLFQLPANNTSIRKTYSYELENMAGLDTQEMVDIKFIQSQAYARRHHQSVAVLAINIDNFHDVAALGDNMGNLLLKTVAIRLLYCKRETDILSRLDENKFILIVSEVLLGDEITTVVNKILKTFAEKTIINDNKVQIQASIGISLSPKDGNDLPDLIKNSETALSYLATNENSEKEVSFQIYDAEIMNKEHT